jgi:glutamate-ammonia-ligase adenylyltransferase
VKPDLETLKSACPEVDERLLREHLARLGGKYFESFDLEQVTGHLRRLSRLSSEHPLEIILGFHKDGRVECTVLAFDYPSEFSLITGVLAGMGFSILSGNVFTYERAAAEPVPGLLRRPRRERGREADLRRRRIIDHFEGRVTPEGPLEEWAAELRSRLEEVIHLLERGERSAVEEAKHRVNEMVTQRLAGIRASGYPVLYPVEIEIDNDAGPFTRMRVVAQDTPAFLYALSTALSLHGLSIEQVSIRTVQGLIEDEIDFVDAAGHKVRDPEVLDKVKLSVLLTKQFTYFLDKASDPYTALARFEQLVEDILRLPESGQWLNALSNPLTLRDLARLLGASDFLWEDFIRLQYESLLPILGPHVQGRRVSEPSESLPERLRQALEGAESFEEHRLRLNQFKDRETFLLDLDHILNPGEVNFRALAERLTVLAENVINTAARLVYDQLAERYGKPRTVAGLETPYAILGLGKLGGAALGYASDVELLFVYSDRGRTDGKEPIENLEFFGHLARETAQFVDAKREGIFHVDLRLRPYGQSGPLASSLESFCRYYGPGGPAHSYERLALVRLRAIAGDQALGLRLERLRDEFVYASNPIQLEELRELREKQFAEKGRPGEYNAKFSPGALVDLEYAVQILQVAYAARAPRLKTPRIHLALEGLAEAGVLEPEESKQLSASYDFLRRLINGLRMLRGSARDLFLPPVDSDEFLHLARRMGYEQADGLEPAQQLRLEFEIRTAAVRVFVEQHFGRDSLPGPAMGNIADLVLSDALPEELAGKILAAAGFGNTGRAAYNFRALAGEGSMRYRFAPLAVLACDMLRREPDPDMALNNWERFLRALQSAETHYELLLAQPKRFEILLGIFSRSQFLAETLIRNPEFLDWATAPENLQRTRRRSELEDELRSLSHRTAGAAAWLDALRRVRRRELLRVGTRDMCLKAPAAEVLEELSTVAQASIGVVLERVWMELLLGSPGEAAGCPSRFSILAFGKLGGGELNYSSDIDLLGLYDDASPPAERRLFALAMERLSAALSRHTVEGYAYRVDMRLRPYGGVGDLVSSSSRLAEYYENEAALWEAQALLKLRPVAGNLELGDRFLARVRPVLMRRRSRDEVVRSIREMRETAIRLGAAKSGGAIDVKNGPGGLRDIEFLAQGLQLIHGPDHPEVLSGNTLEALAALESAGVLPPEAAAELAADYVFLRHVEHYLQILEDQQIHAVPSEPRELEALAKRMLGVEASAEEFLARLEECLARVRGRYTRHLLEGK